MKIVISPTTNALLLSVLDAVDLASGRDAAVVTPDGMIEFDVSDELGEMLRANSLPGETDDDLILRITTIYLGRVS